jgi:transposase
VSDILNLPHVVEVGHVDAGDHYQIQAAGTVTPAECPRCGGALYSHGTRGQTYIDTPLHGKRALLEIDRRRFRCKECGKTLFEDLPDMDDKRQMTRRLLAYVERHSLRKTFADLSREVGVDDKTIRHIFDDYRTRLGETVHFETPRILGIDELKIIGEYRAMITNIEQLALFDMLPTRKKVDLLEYFKNLPDKRRVEIITMDMWNVYRQVMLAQLPRRLVVVDRFHVVRMANDALDRVRKSIRKDLDTATRIKLKDDRKVLFLRRHDLDADGQAKLMRWTAQFPRLAAAYALKEAFCDIYSYPDKASGQRAAKDWLNSIAPDQEPYFRQARTALVNWWHEIFNYFDHPVTNAYTESINNIAKGMNRMGRGYSFEVIRARLLFDDGARADTRKTIRPKPRVKRPPEDNLETLAMGFATDRAVDTQHSARVIEYGPSLVTLARKLNEGWFE